MKLQYKIVDWVLLAIIAVFLGLVYFKLPKEWDWKKETREDKILRTIQEGDRPK